MENEIIVNGKKYVLESSIKNVKIVTTNKKGLTFCVIRTYSAGVWAGWINTKSKDLCQEVFEARRLWRWWSQFTLSELATLGIKSGKEKENKYAVAVPKVILKQIIEVIPCSEKAMKEIQTIPNYNE